MQIRDWTAKWLTRGYVRTLVFSGVSREELYEAYGEEKKVFWVEADQWPLAGQCTPFGTILLNDSKLQDLPKEVVDYIFLHEVGHSKLSRILSLGSVVIRIPLMFIAILGIPFFISRWLAFLVSRPQISQLATYSIAVLIVDSLILLPLIVISWLDEGYAELFAISKMGQTAYRRSLEMKREHSNRGVITRVLSILYPPSSLIIWVANRRSV